METQLPNVTDTIHINKDLHLQQVAEVCNINLNQVRSLNPQYRKDIIPGNSELCVLRLPNDFVSTFIDRQDSVFAVSYTQLISGLGVGIPGFEPGKTGPESVVLPLHHSSMSFR